MTLDEQMRLEAIKEAEAIDSGEDTRTKKEMLQEQMEGLKSAGKTIAEVAPVTGDALALYNFTDDMKEAYSLLKSGVSEGDIKDIGLGGGLMGLTALGVLPAGGAAARVAKKGLKESLSDAFQQTESLFKTASGMDGPDDLVTVTDKSVSISKPPQSARKDSDSFKFFGGEEGTSSDKKIKDYYDSKQKAKGKKFDSDVDEEEFIFQDSKGGFIDEADGKFRYEIPTKDLKISKNLTKSTPNQIYSLGTNFAILKKAKGEIFLPDIINNHAILKEYPSFKYIEIKKVPDREAAQGLDGYYSPIERAIYIAPYNKTPERFKSILAHEIQHAIDYFEGRQSGADLDKIVESEMVRRGLFKRNKDAIFYDEAVEAFNELDEATQSEVYEAAYRRYSSISGEVDARNVEYRLANPEVQLEELPTKFADERAPTGKDVKETKEYDDLGGYEEADERILKSSSVSRPNTQRQFKRLDLSEAEPDIKGRPPVERTLDQHLNLEGEGSTSHFITPDGTFVDAQSDHVGLAGNFGLSPKELSLQHGFIRTAGVFTARAKDNKISFTLDLVDGQPITRKQKRMIINAVNDVDLAYLDITDPNTERAIKSFTDKKEIKNYIRTLEESVPNPEYVAGPLDIGVNEALIDGRALKEYTVDTLTEAEKAANTATVSSGKHLVGKKVKPGTKVGIRLNLNSKLSGPPGVEKLQTVHKNNYDGKALSYLPFVTVKNVKFNVKQEGRQAIAARINQLDVPEAKTKHNMASVDGEFVDGPNTDVFSSFARFEEDLKDLVEIGFNPASTHLYIDMITGQAVESAKLATVIGNRVYARGVKYMKKADAPKPLDASDGTPLPSEVRYKMKKGGAVPMNKPIQQQQLELFEGAGKLVKPKTNNDPISGNPVPKASVPEEVRDDIPAQLSEGEFVLPADVVRYHGLEKLMKLRQQAKTGINMMDNMGQLGNAEEATMRDDMPFTPNMQMQTGGAVMQPTITQPQTMTQIPNVAFQGGQNVQSQFAGATPGITVPTAPTYTQVSTAPQYRVPTQQDPATFQDLTGTKPGQLQEYETIKYINPETKEELFIPFIGGEPIYPIPNGFVRADSVEDDTQQDPKTGVQTTQTTQQDSGDEDTVTTKTTRLTEFLDEQARPKQKGTLASTLTDPRTLAGAAAGFSVFGLPGAILGGIVASQKQDKSEQGFVSGVTDSPEFTGDFNAQSLGAYGKTYEQVTQLFSGTRPTFRYGSENGDVDRVTGGTYVNGMAVDENGDAAKGPGGTFSYSSFSDWADHLKAGSESGWRGGVVGAGTYANMSATAKANYDKYASIMGYTQGGQGSDETPPPGTSGKLKSGTPFTSVKTVGGVSYAVTDEPDPRAGSPAPTTTGMDTTGETGTGGTPSAGTGFDPDDDGDSSPSTGTSFGSEPASDPASQQEAMEEAAGVGYDNDPGNFGASDSFAKGGLAQQMKRSGLASKK